MPRLLLRLAVGAAVACAPLLTATAPAAAAQAEPDVEFRDLCAAVQMFVSDLPPNAPIDVVRDGQVVLDTTMPEDNDLLSIVVGAADGAQLAVTGDGEVLGESIHEDPADCSSVPLNMWAELSCDGLAFLHVANTGSDPFPGRLVVFREDPGSADLEFPPGEVTLPLPLAPDAERFLVEVEEQENSFRTWVSLDYSSPEECGEDPVAAVEAVFTDECDQVRVEVTSGIEPPQLYEVVRGTGDQAARESGVVTSSTPREHVLPAQTGDEFAVLVSFVEDVGELGETLVAEHTYASPASCDDGGTGGAGEPGGGEGGGLPITGTPTGAVVAGGLALLAAGAGLVAIARRRRRIRFSSR